MDIYKTYLYINVYIYIYIYISLYKYIHYNSINGYKNSKSFKAIFFRLGNDYREKKIS
jgi:hypothetical protein